MKRGAPLDSNSTGKRAKLQADHSDSSFVFERDPNELLGNQSTDLRGHLSCSCVTPRYLSTKLSIVVKTISPTRRKFEIEFDGGCAEFIQAIKLNPHDEFLLSLQGARVVKLETPAFFCNLPVKLIYEEGAIIKFLKRRQVLCSEVVDTWQLKQHAQLLEGSFFKAPAKGSTDTIFSDRDPVAGPSNHHVATTFTPPTDSAIIPESVKITEVPESNYSKRERRKLRKMKKNQPTNDVTNVLVSAGADSPTPFLVMPSVPVFAPLLSSVHHISQPSSEPVASREQQFDPVKHPPDYTGIFTINVKIKLLNDPMGFHVFML
ncbi:hypothetical protein H0H81_007184 [Sphagnurus paluster]|uniref:Uncharacterized protein n=1 Tax=Sphagnurus paluster TaxID=117069 RepID=A0A9P7GWG6_9AGAR|nr:hypothetical protein H0H81_007184 [Sphagnurus paluster]